MGRVPKGGTESSKRRHKFISFREKIESIKIDPIRKASRKVVDNEETSSYFIKALGYWTEMNLSMDFVEFSEQCSTLAMSLPMILHNQAKIMSLLLEHINNKDPNSLESLLDLVTHFAHDLGPDFHPYFGQTLQAILQLSTSEDANVIEASFNCLAYLFKYLSRLLTTDLRPTYNAISPLLGKTKQRKFVYRFTGESLAYLIRKCTGESLDIIIRHILNDINVNRDEDFLSSIVYLLGESMKSSGTHVHSRTPVILAAILRISLKDSFDIAYSSRLVSGVVANLLHHAEKDTAKPVISTVLNSIDESLVEMKKSNKSPSSNGIVNFDAKLLFVLVSLRKGSRIEDWVPVFQTAAQVVIASSESTIDSTQKKETLVLVFGFCVSLLIYSPPGVSDQWFPELLKSIFKFSPGNFLIFVDFALKEKPGLAAKMTPYVQRYVQSADAVESNVGLLLFECSKYPWIKGFPEFSGDSSFIKRISANLKNSFSASDYPSVLWNLVVLRVSSNYSLELCEYLVSQVDSLLSADYDKQEQQRQALPFVSTILGEIFLALSKHEKHQRYLKSLSGCIKLNFGKFMACTGFLKGLAVFVNSSDKATLDALKPITGLVSSCLRQPSHEFRVAALDILTAFYSNSALLRSCKLIESLPRDVANARNLTMHIRELSVEFAGTATESGLEEIIPAFLFGLLSDRFQPVWQGALDAIELLSSKDQTIIWENCKLLLSGTGYFEPLRVSDSGSLSLSLADVDEPLEIASFAECSNVERLLSNYCKICDEFNEHSCYGALISKAQDSDDFMIEHATPRSLALKVLLRHPNIAEKHSEYFVQHLLWDVTKEDREDLDKDTEAKATDAADQIWAWKDRIVLLEIFSKFKNPKALPRASEVYERYLYLLANRNTNVQKLALKSIMTFKNPLIRKYSENLSALLEDTQFKDEMLSLLSKSSEQEGTVHDEDREELMPMVIRIIFGRAQISKTGGVKQTRRFAVINALHNAGPKYIRLFIELSIGRLECDGFIQQKGSAGFYLDESNPKFQHTLAEDVGEIFVRRELGFLTMLEDIVKILGASLQGSMDQILNALVFSIWHSQHIEAKPASFIGQSVKSIRALGFKCLNGLVNSLPGFNWTPYLDIIYSVMILPRLDDFDKTNFHQESSLMKLFETVSNYSNLAVLLLMSNCRALDLLFTTLTYDSVVDPVVSCVLNVMINILDLKDKANDAVFDELVTTAVKILLPVLPQLLRRSPVNGQLLEKESTILVRLLNDGLVLDKETQRSLVEVTFEALQRPGSQVKMTVKASMLDSLAKLVENEEFTEPQAISAVDSLSPLFKQFRDRYVRTNLATVFNVLGERFNRFSRVGELMVELNSFSAKRLDTPDFDRRLKAFSDINEDLYLDLSLSEWLPILYNVLYFMKDPEELALRTNATYTIKRFVSAAKSNSELLPTLKSLLLKEIRFGIRDSNDIIRVQYVDVLGHIVQSGVCDELEDMQCLLYEHEEQANFFNNICHLQLHRRRRAVTRLAGFAEEFRLRDDNIAHYLIPLLEHYITVKDDDFSHNLADDSIKVLSSLAKHVSWNQYCAILRRYMAYLNGSGDVSMKTALRLIDTMSTSLLSSQEEILEASASSESLGDGAFGISLASTLPKQEKLSAFISDSILPTLMKILSPPRTSTGQIDDVNDDMSVRMPVALPVIKFMKSLPTDLLEAKLPGVLSKVAQILKAKAQDTRDSVRKVLSKITALLGSDYLVFIIRELKSALSRGAHLHILGYTVHSLVSEMGSTLKYGDLDSSSKLIGEIIMEDLFGTTGADKDEEGYISKMREVNQQKSYDTGVLVAQNVHLASFNNLIGPVKTMLLYERLTHKVELKVEELVRRYAQGLYHNEECSSPRFLVMCFELCKMVDDIEQQHEKDVVALSEKNKVTNVKEYQSKQTEDFFTVQLDSRNWEAKLRRKYPQNLHIIRRFVLDALRVVLGKNEHLITVDHLSGLLPIVSSSLGSTYEDVQIAALRLLALIVRLPFPNAEQDVAFYGRRAIDFIRSSTNTNTEICQASLRLLAVMIKSKKEFDIKDSALSYILSRLQNDLEEPDRQGITFTFIRAVLSRKIVVSEVYDVMDKVGKVMVTNQSPVIRDACRSAYFQFMTEYPQGQARISKQMSFLVANLEYPATAGRLSVMEVMHLFFTKVDPEQIKSFLTSVFAGLVLVLVNDEVPECRENASVVISDILTRVGQEELAAVESFCLSWLSRDNDNSGLVRGGLLVAGLFFAELGLRRSPKLQSAALERIQQILSDGAFDTDSGEESEWQLTYGALQLFSRMVQLEKDSNTPLSKTFQGIWPLVDASLLYPHTWVRFSAARLMGLLYSNFVATETAKEQNELISNPRLLQSSAYKSVRQLGAPHVSDALATQIVKNLAFIAKLWEGKDAIYYANIGKAEGDNSSGESDLEASNDVEGTGAGAEVSSILSVDWLVDRLSFILRSQKHPATMKASKKAAAQLLALLSQLVSEEHLVQLSKKFVLAYYYYSTTYDERDKELTELCQEALTLLQNRVGVTEFTKAYSSAKEEVLLRQSERRSKRAIESVVKPDQFARRKMKKHMVKRDKRRQNKDSDGYYHTKRKRYT